MELDGPRALKEVAFLPPAIVAAINAAFASTTGQIIVRSLLVGLETFFTVSGALAFAEWARQMGQEPETISEVDWFVLVITAVLTGMSARVLQKEVRALVEAVPEPIKQRVGAYFRDRILPMIKRKD